MPVDTFSLHDHDGQVEPTYPTGKAPDPGAVPGARPQTEDEGESTGFTLEVDGELFALRPDEYGGTDYTWLSGPNPGYGFAESPTPDRSDEEHRESIRAFLRDIDPDTGFLTED